MLYALWECEPGGPLDVQAFEHFRLDDALSFARFQSWFCSRVVLMSNSRVLWRYPRPKRQRGQRNRRKGASYVFT